MAFLEWVKKYWKWMAEFGGAILFFLLGMGIKKKPTIVLSAPADVPKQAEAKAEEQIVVAQQQEQTKEQQAVQQHDATVSNTIQQEQQQSQQMANNPDALNSWLKQVGNDAKGK